MSAYSHCWLIVISHVLLYCLVLYRRKCHVSEFVSGHIQCKHNS